ncbi:hypothetical protein QBC33DRAFT_518813 [Phialemonium atrogriseum]|uniref:Protein kinase domain-containing protein n=1 Tax=Phialemonium atrogriseum TaxID=1093897 RepID=A0AAJ0BW70_9PEZI|nr:uncharacterized protein QBC33DRAFT_518813 [Phialemonium atrogriseum]KAK1763221.1 hypothetical protein QBC33DRAFT_518813 [Phialemonium atrogriseum]
MDAAFQVDIFARSSAGLVPILVRVPYLSFDEPQIVGTRVVTYFDSLNSFDPTTSDFLYATFAVIERDDAVYFGQLAIPKLKITFKEYTSALSRDCVDIIPALLLEEAHTLEAISRHPHPGIAVYHGCRVRRGFVTGLVLDRHVSDLKHYVSDHMGPLDKGPFMEALELAVDHLHSLGLAHNDVNPSNILIKAAGMPVLADFDSCRPVGQRLTYSRGTPGWIDKDDSYDTSETRHDTFAMKKIRAWLDEQTTGS